MDPRRKLKNSQLHRVFCEVLAEKREAAGLTQFGLSKRLKKHITFVNKVECGRLVLSSLELIPYCAAMETTADAVLALTIQRLKVYRGALR